jgi:hypothetical protein
MVSYVIFNALCNVVRAVSGKYSTNRLNIVSCLFPAMIAFESGVMLLAVVHKVQ